MTVINLDIDQLKHWTLTIAMNTSYCL